MKLNTIIEELTVLLRKKVSYTDVAAALDVTRQYANQIKEKDLSEQQLEKLQNYFNVKLAAPSPASLQSTSLINTNQNDCLSIPVLGGVSASMGYGVNVINEEQTASYTISRKLADDLDIIPGCTEIIFAQGDSMLPTIEGGDSLLIDHSRRDIYDGKIYCVRIEGQLYAKRLQKIPPHIVRVVSDNEKYRNFEIDLSKNPEFDFAVIGEVRWWGRVAK